MFLLYFRMHDYLKIPRSLTTNDRLFEGRLFYSRARFHASRSTTARWTISYHILTNSKKDRLFEGCLFYSRVRFYILSIHHCLLENTLQHFNQERQTIRRMSISFVNTILRFSTYHCPLVKIPYNI